MAGARWTPEQLEEYRERTFQPENGATVGLKTVRKSPKQRTAESMLQRAFDPEMEARFERALASTPKRRTQALGRLPAGRMNKTEAAYSNMLQARKMAGEILWWAFEPINIRLAPKTYYRVDFMILLENGQIECHEVKGGAGFTDDALVKIKVAASLLPFQFVAMQLVKGQWIRRDF